MMKGILLATRCSSALRSSTGNRLVLSSLGARLLSTSGSGTTDENHLEAIQSASAALQQASSRLEKIHRTIQEHFSLATGQKVQLKDIVLHARDAEPDDFHHANAKEARRLAQSLADTVETDLQSLGEYFTQHVQPELHRASAICQELPCGGLSLQLKQNQQPSSTPDSSIGSTNPSDNVHVAGRDTPCGKLATATLDFWQQTYDTKEPIILGSRAALILRLAKEYKAPLKSIRNEKQKEMAQAFQQQVVNTPWIRSDEEYQQFFQVKGDWKEKDNSTS